MSTNTITWIHLSDLHFRASERHTRDQDIVLRDLLGDIEEQMSKPKSGFTPDFVVVSGDIAFSGQPDEYRLARSFFDDLLATTHLRKAQLFLVPGNHDVNRNVISFGARSTAQAIVDSVSKKEFRHSVTEVLTSEQDRIPVFKRLQAYGEFINDYLVDHLVYSDARPFYVKNLDVAGVRVAILGLNTAWLCCGDEDRHHILLGEYQVRTAIQQVQDADLSIALLHHPLDWLHDLDQEDITPLLTKQCEFILHGHLHHLGITQLVTPDSGTMIIAAGASYEEREGINAYNLVQLDLRKCRGKILLRRYSDERGGFWTKDVLSYSNVVNGEFQFSLPSSLRLLVRNNTTRKANDTSSLSDWPKFPDNVDTKHLILVQVEFIETQLHDMIKVFNSRNQTHHPVIGKIRNRAHNLVQEDVARIKQLVQRDANLSATWKMLRSIEKDVDDLSEEFLDYLAGSILRQRGVGRELCEWSDKLLTEIGARTGDGWSGTCVLADSAIAGPTSHLVRLAFPNEGIWSLPFAVYQYTTLMSISNRLAILIHFVEPADNIWSVLAADMLATHFSGPAYAFAAATLWFTPWCSQAQGYQEHFKLIFDLRFHFIVSALEQSGDLYTPEIELLKNVWQEKLSLDNSDDSQNDTARTRYKEYAKELYRQVVLLRYGAAVDHAKRKDNAKQLAHNYEHKTSEETLSHIDLVDILNAAWYSRMLCSQVEELRSMKEFYQNLFRRKVAQTER